MSQLVARILLAILMLPLAVFVYIVTAVSLESRSRYAGGSEEMMPIFAGVASWAFMAAYWWALWFRQIKWTTRRTVGSIALVLIAALIGWLIAALFSQIDRIFGAAMGSIIAPLAWLFGTIILWRETKDERGARTSGTNADVVFCASCGYNLTGLSEARCPECGAKFTLNELFARQPQRVAAKIDEEFSK